jgi:hypothetical protein
MYPLNQLLLVTPLAFISSPARPSFYPLYFLENNLISNFLLASPAFFFLQPATPFIPPVLVLQPRSRKLSVSP